MPFNLNDSINPTTAPSTLIGQINGLANQVKNIIGAESWKTPPTGSLQNTQNISSSVPTSPNQGDTWTEIDSFTKKIKGKWQWQSPYWISQELQMLPLTCGFNNGIGNFLPADGSLLIESFFVAVISSFNNVVVNNDENNFTAFYLYKYRFGDRHLIGQAESRQNLYGYGNTYSVNVSHVFSQGDARGILLVERTIVGQPTEADGRHTFGISFRLVR